MITKNTFSTITFFMIVIASFFVTQQAFAAFSGSGSGTSGDPFQITTADELQEMNDYLGSGNSGVYWQLMNDIDLNVAPYNTGTGWGRIGTASGTAAFHGQFDGNYHTISNLFIDSANSNEGLFGYVEAAATIENVVLSNIDVTGGNNQVAGLVGYNLGTVQNVGVDGGTVSGVMRLGGVIGSNRGVLQRAYATGLTITQRAASIECCIGGITGATEFGGSINNSYARSNLVHTSGGQGSFGGAVGSTYTAVGISNLYSTGTITTLSSYPSNVGGLMGNNSVSATDSYWDTETSGQATSASGTGKLTSEMTDQATYVGWDFGSIWDIDPGTNDGYPTLQWQNNLIVDVTPPAIDTLSPVDDATSVPLDTTFSVAFDENVNETAVFIEFAFGLYKSSDDSVVFELTNASPYLDVIDNVLSVPSLVELESGTEYYIQIADDYLYDNAGNFYTGINDATTWNFTTLTQPYIVSVDPTNGATGVDNEPTFTVTFSEAMNTGSSLMFSTSPCNFDGDCAIPSVIEWSEGDTVATIQNGNGPYAYDTTYTMIIGQGIDADEGADLAEPYEWVFTIGPEPVSESTSSGSSQQSKKIAKEKFGEYYAKQEGEDKKTEAVTVVVSTDDAEENEVVLSTDNSGLVEVETIIDLAPLQVVIANGGLLRRGSKGDAVTVLQQLLNQLGAEPQLLVDGDFGRLTHEAVEVYQQANGLIVDGIIGKDTLAVLLQ